MAVRQYIGARYVTKIYENSLDPSSAEWEPGVTYEPLTLVTYMNSSYLSKKDVPGAIGDPAANPSYWVVTGAYNGQIASLQNQIDIINNTTVPAIYNAIMAMNKVSNRKMIMLTDSFGGPNYHYGGQNCLEIARDHLGLDSSSCECLWQDGVGFVYDEFLTLLQTSTSDPDTITDIVVVGGANDQPETGTNIINAITTFCNYVYTNYPYARITILYDSFRPLVHGDNYVTCIESYKKGATYNGAAYGNITQAIHSSARMNADGIHPTSSGTNQLGITIARFIECGDSTNELFWTQIKFKAGENCQFYSNFYQGIFGENIVSWAPSQFRLDFTTALNLNDEMTADLGELSDFVMMSVSSQKYIVPIICNIVGIGNNLPCGLMFQDGHMYLVNNSGQNFTSVSNIYVKAFSDTAVYLYN